MFKVHENGDGSTSIFCSKTGRLICNIRNHQKNMGLGCRPVNVIEPSPKPRSCCYNLDIKPECLSGEDAGQKSGNEKCDNLVWNEPKEDFSEDCITPDDYARCLNLVPKEKFKNEPSDELKFTFPLRHISKIQPLVSSDDSREVKLEVPITSTLGLKILKLNEQKNFCSDQTETKVKNYDGFCRLQMNAAYVLGQFPKLRCREKKDYPIIPMQNKKTEYTPAHVYAFNKKQRLEKLITFKTGLNTDSRKLLLQQCNKRLAVSIKRLPDDEIKYWMQKRARFGPINPDLIKGEQPAPASSNMTAAEQIQPVYIDLCSDESSSESSDSDDYDPSYKYHVRKDSNIPGVISNAKKRSSTSPQRNQMGQYLKQPNTFEMKDCYVMMDDVLFCSIYKYGTDYYVAGTNIRVPFLEGYLESLDSGTRKKLVIPTANFLANAQFDHAYHRPFSQNFYSRKLLTSSNCLNHKSSVTKNNFKTKLQINSAIRSKSSVPVSFSSLKNSTSFKPTVSKIVSKPPIINLDDISVSSPRQQFECIFQCYGCGFKETSSDQSDIYSEASRHLRAFHCVTDPTSFLNICRTPSSVTFEAFPGYKK